MNAQEGAVAMSAASSPYRLPGNVRPVHYGRDSVDEEFAYDAECCLLDLNIKTDLESLSFQGVVVVDLEVSEETSEIVFNAAEDIKLNAIVLHIQSQSLEKEDLQFGTDLDPQYERVTIRTRKPLLEGSKPQLTIVFGGKLSGSSLGYHSSSYQVNGTQKYCSVTQFEPTFARRAFPCWDEPAFKASYKITMVSREETVNISNMPVASETAYTSAQATGGYGIWSTLSSAFSYLTLRKGAEPQSDIKAFSLGDGRWKSTEFETSPVMSTYLVAFANGDFKVVEDSYTSPISGKVIPVRVYTTPDGEGQAEWSLNVSKTVMPLYEKVFDVEFPLPKLDTLVANDYHGAMENWGLIIGQPNVYLMDPNKPDFNTTQRIAEVQTHEIAHQWFGNIVTMSWWDNLWLNEGFATIMGALIILDNFLVKPEWNSSARFLISQTSDALALDSRRSSHPIQNPVDNPNEIKQLLDQLTYAKAASVLRMLSAYVGEEQFLKGVSLYLKKHLYGNSTANDLWDGIAEATGLDIRSLMDNWITRIGYPVVTVTEKESGVIHIRQDRFLVDGSPAPEENETLWNIPLSILTSDNTFERTITQRTLLNQRETDIKLDTTKPFKLNGGSTGVYRVRYSTERAQAIAKEAAKEGSIFKTEDRIGLVSDTLALAQASLSDTSSLLNVIELFKDDKENLGWTAMNDAITKLVNIFWEDEELSEGLRIFQQSLYAPIVERLGYDNQDDESVDVKGLRTLAIARAAAVGEPKVVKELLSRWKAYNEGDESAIPADILGATFRVAVEHGGRAEWETMKKIYESSASPATHLPAIGGMCSSKDPELIKEVIEYTKKPLRTQDFDSFWITLANNSFARRILIDYTYENFDAIFERFGRGFNTMRNIIESTFGKLTTEEDATKLEDFLKNKDTAGYNMAVAQTLELIRVNTKWRRNATEDVKGWLDERKMI
ncbi:hypothetical protein SISSUDRAFT_1060871 [Sistotremastrum suecicum HHB10207 ss-3]|uniref:Aminopeptidase n=1 Tax=Sistotremastrum suecicum HHB10207 ss-3 TaxID=1314776 RepID=A0A166EQ17_9AGAM|nr:hypothetical protein SISSUDRAFT_1060871 [Sistotremastrum suecicum HHB10207 ss-3]